jgi:hypothetical protein
MIVLGIKYTAKYNYGYSYFRLGFTLSPIYLVDFDGCLGSERLLKATNLERRSTLLDRIRSAAKSRGGNLSINMLN